MFLKKAKLVAERWLKQKCFQISFKRQTVTVVEDCSWQTALRGRYSNMQTLVVRIPVRDLAPRICLSIT